MFGQLSGSTRLFPIIGDPIKYVESPMRLTRTFEERGHNGICIPMQVAADDLDAAMAGLTASRNVDGILVTMPHKFTAFAYCATSSERAKMLGVVSVMRRNPDGTWHGDMLDGLAFVKAQKDHGAEPAGARVLLVGAGGAGSAIAIAFLLEAGVDELVIHDADESRVSKLIELFVRPQPGAGECRTAGSHRLRSRVQRDSHGHGGERPASRRCCTADIVHVRRRCDSRTRADPFPPGCGVRRLQDGQRRTYGRGRAGRYGGLHAAEARFLHTRQQLLPSLSEGSPRLTSPAGTKPSGRSLDELTGLRVDSEAVGWFLVPVVYTETRRPLTAEGRAAA